MGRPPPRVFTRRTRAEAGLLSRRFASRGLPFSEGDVEHMLDEGAEAWWYDPTNGAVLLAPCQLRPRTDAAVNGPRSVLAMVALGNVRIPDADDLGPNMFFAHRFPESEVLGEREAEHALLHYVVALVREQDPAAYFARWNNIANAELVAGQRLFSMLRRVVLAHAEQLFKITDAVEAIHGPFCTFVVPPLPLSRRVSVPVGRAASLYWGHVLETRFHDRARAVSESRLRVITEGADLHFPMLVPEAMRSATLVVPALTQTADTLVPEEDGEVAVFEHGIVPSERRPDALGPGSLPVLVWHDDGTPSSPALSDVISLSDAISLAGAVTPPPPPRYRSPEPDPAPRAGSASPVLSSRALSDAPTMVRDGPPSDTPLQHAERQRSPRPVLRYTPPSVSDDELDRALVASEALSTEPRPPPRGMHPGEGPGDIEIPRDLRPSRDSGVKRLIKWWKRES